MGSATRASVGCVISKTVLM